MIKISSFSPGTVRMNDVLKDIEKVDGIMKKGIIALYFFLALARENYDILNI